MIYSMTGFGRSIVTKEGRELQVELKSVNHRYLDISVRMPKALCAFEDMIRKTISSRLKRGHIDVFVTYRNTACLSREVQVDLTLLSAYLGAFSQIRERFPQLENDISLLSVSRLPDVLTVIEAPEDEQTVSGMLTLALDEALDSVLRMRASEGEHLVGDIRGRLDLIRNRLGLVEQRSPSVVLEYREKLSERITALLQGTTLDAARLQTEVAIFADRSSITEEIVRLDSHLGQVAKTLDAGGAVGRKLDFVVQEMNREANTIGSKANDLEITNSVLEIKGETEKIREQVQNIE